MTDSKRPSIDLEICSGFFRIPTENVIYNITVLPFHDHSTAKVVEKIIEVEKIVEIEKPVPIPVPATPAPAPAPTPERPEDDYFPRLAHHLAEELSRLCQDGEGGGGPDTGGLRDLAGMAAELSDVLKGMKAGLGRPVRSAGGTPANLTSGLEALGEKIAQAVGLGAAIPAEPVPAASSASRTRHLFNLDAIFQTMYELCTNETVKAHIQGARGRAGEIFAYDDFIDAISPKVAGYREDDGFFNVPMTDIYTALAAVCSDKSICNLLSKMDKQQGAIFLDQFLPLEVPATEEVAVSSGGAPAAAGGSDPELAILLAECQTAIDSLIYQAAAQADTTPAPGADLTDDIDQAMTIALSIRQEAEELAESAPTAAGGASRQASGLGALVQTMLDRKAAAPDLTFADGLAAGQRAAEERLQALQPKTPPPKAPPPPPPPAKDKGFGEASQDDIDRLLEELG